MELGKVLVEDGGDLGIEGRLVLDDGREDGKELDVHVGVREVARGREELLTVGLYPREVRRGVGRADVRAVCKFMHPVRRGGGDAVLAN